MELTGLLREALDFLDDDVRAAFVLCDLVDLPAEEAAAILKTSPERVRQNAHRARLLLQGFLLNL
jgi:DNA-directed RNA polymerase specialized sigma24 family protein